MAISRRVDGNRGANVRVPGASGMTGVAYQMRARMRYDLTDPLEIAEHPLRRPYRRPGPFARGGVPIEQDAFRAYFSTLYGSSRNPSIRMEALDRKKGRRFG